ncbi:MAG: aminotransferase class I/II-fold pyridoxal phosphate-dependent enzyme, partial [Hymenobacteraceae bacterium]|nr:aminotransferase class I/II-fold pyridoxal phosphate-dependent enzyme [Hymenobacteraceae bacterium]
TRPGDDFAPDVAALEAAVTPRTKALLLGYPNNPTGAVLSRPVALALAALAERHDLLVYSDEIYDRLVYDAVAHICFASLPGMRDRTITLGGFSKSYAMTGWRIGYLCAHPALTAACVKAHQYLIMSAPTVGQYAALAALKYAEADVQAMVTEYDRRRLLLLRGFRQIGLPCPEPRGAFYAFPSVAHLTDDPAAFCEGLLRDEQVALIPGAGFGASGAGHVRACYATAYPKIEEALDRLGRYVRRVEAGVLAGV